MMLPALNSLNHLIPSQTTYRPLQKQQQTDQISSQKMQRIEMGKNSNPKNKTNNNNTLFRRPGHKSVFKKAIYK